MTEIDRQQIIDALRTLDDTEARQVFDESRGQDRTTKQQRAAQAIRDYQDRNTITPKKES